MFRFGGLELVVVLVIVLLLFGPGRIGGVFGEIGKGIRFFKQGIQGNDKTPEENTDTPNKPL